MITKVLGLLLAIGFVATASESADAQEPIETVFSCPQGVSMRARFTSQEVEISISGTLSERPAASGIWYEGPLGTLRGKGGTVDWTAGAPIEDCVTVPGGAALVGHVWELVEFQSPEDAIGTTVAEDPTRHTLAFRADGSVSVGLDCNVGHGEWTAAPSNPTGGDLGLAKIATTRALCHDDQFPDLSSHLEYIRSYTIEDGELHLSMVADGGIYSWRPAP